MDATASSDWRAQFQTGARLRVVSKIMDTLKRQLPGAEHESLDELRNMAAKFEEKTFSDAASQDDYVRKISMKMISMESRPQNTSIANQMPSNPANQNAPDAGSHVLQPKLQNTGQSLSIPLPNQSQTRPQTLSQGLQNNLASAAVQGSATLASSMASMNGSNQSNISNIGVSNLGQSIPHNIYANSHRQIQGRSQQQSMVYQKQLQQSLNPHLYQQQLQQQQQSMKAKLPHPSLLQSQVQQQQQQVTQMQSSQRPLMQMPSSLQSSQNSHQQSQPPSMQSILHSEGQQNQPNMLQQFSSPLLQQHPQAVLRQQQLSQTSIGHLQASSLQQQLTPGSQQPTLRQQQQLLGHQSNITSMQQSQLSQQNGISDIQQQQYRLASQQNNLMSMQTTPQMNMSMHQQVAPQSSMPALQQLESQQQMQQQSHLLGSQTNISNVYQQAMHIMQPQKAAAHQQPQQQQQQQSQSQGEQLQPNPVQQQLMPQIQNQTGQLQHKFPTQQQPNPLQSEMQPMQQRLRVSGGLLHPQNVVEQQKAPHQSQRGLPEALTNSLESTSQMGHVVPDWQEDAYQKIQSMRELYNAELAELHQKISLKFQQHDAQVPPGKHSEQLETMKKFKLFLDRLVLIFQLPKSSIQPLIKEKLPYYEKQLLSFFASSRRKIPPQLQRLQQFPHAVGETQSMPQPPQSQVPPIQQHDNHGNQVPQVGVQGSVISMQSTIVSSQSGSMSLPSHAGGPAAQQSIMSPSQACSNVDSSHDGALPALQQGAMGHVQHMKLEHQQHQQLMHPHQIKQQMQQHQVQQQKQQILQQQPQIQQQFHQQQKQHQPAQLQAHQMALLHQMNEMNDLKIKQGSAIKSGLSQSHFPTGQCQTYPHQQLKPGASLSISSSQSLQATSPQISQHSSPQVDQGLLPSIPKAMTPLQSTNSPYLPSPSTPLTPSPLPGDLDKQVPGISALQNAGSLGHQLTSVASNQAPLIAVGTPGISASPLLAEYASLDTTQAHAQEVLPGKSNAIEQPIERLVKAVQSSSPDHLISAMSDICSVVSMIDRVAGSAPGNGSRAAVGEDLAGMTKCRLQARNFLLQDGSGARMKMKRRTCAMPSDALLSAGCINEHFKGSSHELAELESTDAASQFKRPRVEADYSLLEEIREINQQLIGTAVGISDEVADSVAAAAEGGEGTVVKCSYSAVALSPNLKSQLTSAPVPPISPLRLLIPISYPKCSPVLLDKILIESSKESEDLSAKAMSRFIRSLCGLPQPMSLGEMVRTWDACAHKVIEEYTLQYGGGSFSSRYGGWENCVAA